jgi:ribosomal protein L37E
MPRLDYKNCRACGRHADDAGPLSHTRLCAQCGDVRNRRAALEQHHHSGEFFQVWRRALAASVGGVLLDDARPNP